MKYSLQLCVPGGGLFKIEEVESTYSDLEIVSGITEEIFNDKNELQLAEHSAESEFILHIKTDTCTSILFYKEEDLPPTALFLIVQALLWKSIGKLSISQLALME